MLSLVCCGREVKGLGVSRWAGGSGAIISLIWNCFQECVVAGEGGSSNISAGGEARSLSNLPITSIYPWIVTVRVLFI